MCKVNVDAALADTSFTGGVAVVSEIKLELY
jgi:hypothetical protein